MFKMSEKTEYMYKYMIGFLFLNFAIHSDIHYSISNNILKYFKHIKFICLLIIIYICSLDISSGILLAISFIIFDNIINVKKYLRELFTNYYESFSNSFKLTDKEIKEIKNHCEKNKWKDDTCSELKTKIINTCMTNDPWKPIVIGKENNKIVLDCPEIRKTF
jgi:hypothetical protein